MKTKNNLKNLLKNSNNLRPTKNVDRIKIEEDTRIEKRILENKNKTKLTKNLLNNKKKHNEKKNNSYVYDIDNLKIIGITGTFGKTSVAVLVHRYLQSIGKKSVLYSSAYIDSPATWINRKCSFDSIYLEEDDILNIINECIEYEAEYLILECWEGSISRGIFDNVPFDLKVLTSFSANHVRLSEEENYFNNKLKFLAEGNVPVIMNLNKMEADLPTGKRVDFIKNIKSKKIYYGLDKPTINELSHLNLKYSWNDDYGWYRLKTLNSCLINMEAGDHGNFLVNIHLMGGINIINALGAFAILDFFKEVDVETWKEFIEDESLYITGRDQVIDYKGRRIIISPSIANTVVAAKTLAKHFEEAEKCNLLPYKENGYDIPLNHINKIIGVVGLAEPSVVGANQYLKEFNEKINRDTSNLTESFFGVEWVISDNLAKIYNENLDRIIISPTNLGSAKYEEVIKIMRSKLTIPTQDNKNRYKAILQAIMSSEKDDVILVLGRGNRNTNIINYQDVELGSDLDFINKAIKALDSIDFE